MLFLAIIINTNHCSLVDATFAAALSSSHYPGETVIRIDSYQAGGLFLALTQASPSERQRVTFGTTQKSRLRSAPHSQGYHSAREVRNFNSPAFGLTPMVPRTPHFLR